MIVYLPSYPVEDVYVPDQVKEAVAGQNSADNRQETTLTAQTRQYP